jgi:hypothetical protein
MDKILITQDDIKAFRPTAELDNDRINPFIREAQVSDLKPVLNAALYLDFLKKFDDNDSSDYAKYQELLLGKEYSVNGITYLFEGVRPMLAYYSLARFVAANPVNITRMGIVTKRNDNSEPADHALIRGVVNELRSAALGYQNEVIKFLCDNASSYPLYNLGGGSSNSAKSTSFNFFKL